MRNTYPIICDENGQYWSIEASIALAPPIRRSFAELRHRLYCSPVYRDKLTPLLREVYEMVWATMVGLTE